MKKKIIVLAFVFCGAILSTVPAAAYTTGQIPPTGMARSTPYLLLNAGGVQGYIYPTAAMLEYMAITPEDMLSVNMSSMAIPSRPTSGLIAQRLYTLTFYPAPTGDSSVRVLALYFHYPTAPNGGTQYPISVQWGWLNGSGTTNYFNGTTPTWIAGEVKVLDTNISQFSPKNALLGMQSANGILLTVLGVLGGVALLLYLISFIGRYRKGANAY